ncbi:MAG TPA: hypothetical protein VGU68_21210, partial [Ktedonobacteraceae bacterium]|nr:hypothetical protein [Ktedonobacteraceae bacterium]
MSTKNTTILISGASIAGANHPTWLGLARELGIGLMTRTGEDHFALFGLEMKHVIDGEEIKPDKGKILEEDMKKIFIEIGNDAKQIKKPAVPWSESDPFIRKHLQEFDDMSVDDRLGQLKTKLKLNNPTLAFREMEMLLGNNLV